MRFQSTTFLAAALLVGVAASPAIAAGALNLPAVPVPGPVAGAGLGFLVLAGGYYAVRHWRKQNPGE
jgi:hypothetical protein